MKWTIQVVLLSSLVGLGIFCLGVFVWAQGYEGRLPPGTFIAGVNVEGMDPETIRQAFQEHIDTILTNGIIVRVGEQERTVSFVTRTASDLAEDVDFDLEGTLVDLMSRHQQNSFEDSVAMLASRIKPIRTTIPVTVQRERIQSTISNLFPDAEILSQPSTFSIVWTGLEWSIEVIEGSTGTEFQWKPFFETLAYRLSFLDDGSLTLSLIQQESRVSAQEAQAQIDLAQAALAAAPYSAKYQDDTWSLSATVLAGILTPGEDGQLSFLDEPLAQWITTITDDLNQDARDARLEIENGRVVNFVESLEERILDEEQLIQDLHGAMTTDSNEPIQLILVITPPQITTSDVNDLGIDEILGFGTSSYRGSPTNRRANIQNGVDLLDGLLIAPGETFSLLKALSPFTYDNGYLPELVIKGDKIVPEIGGGLCQIGTTTFRATMNSGLPVTQRRNHSLVVSYYNDPSNGNPGTDATIYEPAPDFKFTNDTGRYVLFQAQNLTDTQELEFTFWGTSDGRIGSYTPPVVSRWIPVGQTQYIETLDLEPGEEECQGAHIGADASFVYSIVRSTGDVEETTYESHYRPLPRICLIGVEELSVPEESENSSEENDS
jgi:vancomycin resistance protein YoaR